VVAVSKVKVNVTLTEEELAALKHCVRNSGELLDFVDASLGGLISPDTFDCERCAMLNSFAKLRRALARC